MARMFRQRDIQQMDVNNIPDGFAEYYSRLSEERRQELAELRPDLIQALQNEQETQEDAAQGIQQEEDKLSVEDTMQGNMTLEEPKEPDGMVQVDSCDEFAEIRVNAYENFNLNKIIKDDMQPFEALGIKNKPTVCYLHHTPVTYHQINYHTKSGAQVGAGFFLCPACNRLYIEESKVEKNRAKFSEYGIPAKIYGLSLTNRYLRSIMTDYELDEDEKIGVPGTWVEEHPTCPIHNTELQKIPCVKKYWGRILRFNGYICDECGKIMLRRSMAVELEDRCASEGIPLIEYEEVVQRKPAQKPVPQRNIKPDFFVEDGKVQPYTFRQTTAMMDNCYILSMSDSVVVSDSIYCSVAGHDYTEEVLALIQVQEKQKGGAIKSYLFKVGFCGDCQKYYMEERDYKAAYARGHLNITVLLDVEDDEYLITSGEIFEQEEKHLETVEQNIHNEIDSIISSPDYVSQYETGAYDDGNLRYSKNRSKKIYEPRLEELGAYANKPYEYRVDITRKGESEIFYVGATDIVLGKTQHVISANSRFGRELIHYQTRTITKEGKEYDIKLSRQFDIEKEVLYGYTNLRDGMDIAFRKGITDPFLVKVLNLRKKQHNLIDIFVTIQENQNAIVDVPFRKNLIVQGCAGSGKTMVLLHRLASLKYNEPNFDFSNAMIVTPNEQFNLHIKGLAEGLQIGSIRRRSVEEYYSELLMEYSPEFRVPAKLTSEMTVRQTFVDYIYSDQFLVEFHKSYEMVIEERNVLIKDINALILTMGGKPAELNFSHDDKVVPFLIKTLDTLEAAVKLRISEAEQAKTELDRLEARKQTIEQAIPEIQQKFAETLLKAQGRAYNILQKAIAELQEEVEKERANLQQLKQEEETIITSLNPFGKQKKLTANRKQQYGVQERLENKQKLLNAKVELMQSGSGEKSQDEILEWLVSHMNDLPDIRADVRSCGGYKNTLIRYANEYEDLGTQIQKAVVREKETKENLYPTVVSNRIKALREKCQEYTLQGIFGKIFDTSVAEFCKEHDIKSPVGRTHRYDLYAQLVFAMRYFDKQCGTERFLCVDEGQDLAINEYRLLVEVNHNDAIFNIYGDTNQLIKPGRGIQNWAQLEELLNADEYCLNENYRNTNQITKFCNESFSMDVLQTGVDGVRVREIPRKELEKELAKLPQTTERIAVLVPRGIVKRQYLKKEFLPESILERINEDMGNGHISVMYVDEVKGIEFDKVFVASGKMTENERYIAYTRALSELIIVTDAVRKDATLGIG